MLNVNAISKCYDGQPHPLLSQLSLTLASGESASIQGESGCGKSTLLSLIAGFDTPDSGDIRVGDKSLTSLNARQADAFRRQHLGVVFQSFNLLDCYNVWDNVAFTARLKGNYNPAYQQELLDRLGLADHQHQAVTSLSGGEQQRVAIARALSHQPDLLLADEPTGNLDEQTSEQVCSLLFDECRQRNIALLLVTHSPVVAARADSHYLLSHGMLHRQDSK